MQESGRVVAIEPDALWVETIQRSTCGTCAAQKGCGQGLLNKLGDGKRNHLRVLLGDTPASEFALDDEVQFSVPENVLLKGAAIVYLTPLLMMLLGMGLIHELTASDKLAALGALMGFVAGFGLVRVHALFTRNRPELQPQLVSHSRPSRSQPQSLSL
ncbi:SoxR reducing system RseC family protein [Litorivivens sp.]|uniref:SoxR reducing system RseC family protein n=1 Tax=Litorivivens sp. TaxID=2020868 RepID=UPI00356891BF